MNEVKCIGMLYSQTGCAARSSLPILFACEMDEAVKQCLATYDGAELIIHANHFRYIAIPSDNYRIVIGHVDV
ncbi:hypothetical protein L1D14_03815 [Vibrio tubiashii]|uniref:hypothetical protein n=1 Tax=Vibrio tubiashii TaxID=29498 RepID=UPI001EFEBA7F|nr:hypothetical protein [Vibrio tubiashii]MCG9575357.1 hypothetical protein [Vibrio tubiashii]